MDMKKHDNFIFIIIYKAIFQNLHLSTIISISFSHTIWKLPFQSGAKYHKIEILKLTLYRIYIYQNEF